MSGKGGMMSGKGSYYGDDGYSKGKVSEKDMNAL